MATRHEEDEKRKNYRRDRSERLDAILVKVSEKGVESLSAPDRATLEEISDELHVENELSG